MPPDRQASRGWSILALALFACGTRVEGGALGDEQLEARRLEIARLQPAEQQELLHRQERFAALPPEEQERLRSLQSALDSDPHAERLHQVLVRYHEWLKTLTPSQRAKLAELSPPERVAEIKRIQRQQNAVRERMRRAELLSPHDMREVLRWTEDFVWSRREGLVSEMSSDQRRRFDTWDKQRQKHALLMRAFDRARRQGGGGLAALEQSDVDRLAAELSQPARDALTEAGALPAQRRIVGSWIGTSMHRLEPWTAARKPNPLVVDDLLQFLQNEVAPAERERLLKLPQEKMLQELRGMYFERGRTEMGRPGGRVPPWGAGHGPDRSKGNSRKGGRGPAGTGKQPNGDAPQNGPDAPQEVSAAAESDRARSEAPSTAPAQP
jgi:hypothetical protein